MTGKKIGTIIFGSASLIAIGYAIYKMFPTIDTPQKVADKAAEYSHIIGYAILAVVVGVAIYFLVKHLKKK